MVCPPRVRRFSQRHPTWTRNINARPWARRPRRRRNGFWGIFDTYGRPYPSGNHQGASSLGDDSPSSSPFPPPVQQSPSPTEPPDIPVQKQQIAGITLSVQINPDDDPIPLEFYISQHDPDTDHVPDEQDEATLTTARARIRLCSPVAVFTRPPKRHRQGSQSNDEPPSKRRHVSLPHALSGSSPRYAPNSNALGDASNRNESGPSLPGDSAYMVELGLVRAYPSAEDIADSHETQSWSSSEDSLLYDQSFGHTTLDDSLPSAQLLLDMPYDDAVHLIHPTRVLIRSAVITTAIIVILFIGLHVIILIIAPLILGAFATQNPLGQLPDSPLQPVDWFQEAAEIEMAAMSISRVVLFGETSQEDLLWQCQPGLRPDDGPLHDNSTRTDPIIPEFDTDSPLYPRYKPWETASNGQYIPEGYFLADLERVLGSTLSDIQDIANHGPFEFRFTQGSSTQFRWSTSASKFLPPHDSLPILPFDYDDNEMPGSTIYGVPPLTEGQRLDPSPTGRPADVWSIYNLDPPLTQLCRKLETSLQRVKDLHYRLHNQLVTLFPGQSLDRVNLIMFRLSLLLEQQSIRNGTWGSDQERLDCIFPQRTIHLSTPTTTSVPRPPPPGLKDIPANIPLDYLEQVFKAHAKSVSASASITSSSTPITTRRPSSMPCHSRRYHSPAEWSHAQDNNGTAHELVDILDITTGHDFGKEMNTHAPHLFMLMPYRDALEETSQYLASLNDRIKQVLTTANIQDLDWTRTKESFTRLEDVARFLSQIATVRIDEMYHRAERGTSLLEATELRQTRLRNEVASGWIGAPVSIRRSGEQLSLLHFPSIQTVMSMWHHTTKWIRAEVSSLQDTHAARELAFNRRREKERKDKTSAMRPVIWSRWEMGDTRRESFGREAFCWDWGPVKKRDKKGCGDGSLRHGKD
ncbi:hypothetical protein Neosp_015153 [[Neocosmospora] mangrovei]